MANIKHFFTIKANPEQVYKAFTTEEGLKAWWTSQVKAGQKPGETLEFGFQPGYVKKFKLEANQENKAAAWTCTEAHPEWVDTKVKFEIVEDKENEAVKLFFSHDNWKEETEMHAMCNTHWGIFLQGLKSYCEGGKGNPFGSN